MIEYELCKNNGKCILDVNGYRIPVCLESITHCPDEPTGFEGHFLGPEYKQRRLYTEDEVNHLVKARGEKGLPKIEKVIFNNPATIVYWKDGTKTVVKAQDEVFDEEKGLAMAISKKALGNEGNYYEEFKKWVPERRGAITVSLGKIGEALRNLKVPTITVTTKSDTNKICSNCKHVRTLICDDPCLACSKYSKFEAKQ